MAATSKDEKWEGPLMPTVQPAAPFAAVQRGGAAGGGAAEEQQEEAPLLM